MQFGWVFGKSFIYTFIYFNNRCSSTPKANWIIFMELFQNQQTELQKIQAVKIANKSVLFKVFLLAKFNL